MGKMDHHGKKFELVLSNNTLEHIPERHLGSTFRGMAGLMEPGTVSSHFIDMSDHYSHLDRSISTFHFLKYSHRTWKWIDNSIQPQNRLRINAYRNLFEESGFPAIIEKARTADLEDLRQADLAPPFKKLQMQDLLATHAYLAGVFRSPGNPDSAG